MRQHLDDRVLAKHVFTHFDGITCLTLFRLVLEVIFTILALDRHLIAKYFLVILLVVFQIFEQTYFVALDLGDENVQELLDDFVLEGALSYGLFEFLGPLGGFVVGSRATFTLLIQDLFAQNRVFKLNRRDPLGINGAFVIALVIQQLVVNEVDYTAVFARGYEVINVTDRHGALTLREEFNELFQRNLIISFRLLYQQFELLRLLLVHVLSFSRITAFRLVLLVLFERLSSALLQLLFVNRNFWTLYRVKHRLKPFLNILFRLFFAVLFVLDKHELLDLVFMLLYHRDLFIRQDVDKRINERAALQLILHKL